MWKPPTTVRLPAISSFKVIEAVVGVNTVAFCVTGTNPAFVTSSSCWPAQTPRAVKKPLTFVWARTLYGVSANDMLASDSGTSSSVKILPVSRWLEHVQASQASFSVPMVQFFEQSGKKSFANLYKANCWLKTPNYRLYSMWLCDLPKFKITRRVCHPDELLLCKISSSNYML